MKTLFHFLSEYKKELFLGPFLKLLEAIIEIFLPFFIADSLNKLSFLSSSQLIQRGIFMLFLIMIGCLAAILAQFFAAKTSQGFAFKLRKELFSHSLKLSSKQTKQFGSSSLVNRIIFDVTNLETAVAMFIRLVIRVPFVCIGSFIMIFYFDQTLAFVLLCFIFALAFCILLISKSSSKLHKKANQKLDKMALQIKENLSNIRLIRSLVSQSKEKKKLDHVNMQIASLSKFANFISGLFNPISTFILDIAILFVLYIGHFHLLSGNLSQGDLIAIINYITQILLSVVVLSNLIVIYTKAFASKERVLEILNEKPVFNGGNLSFISSSSKDVPLQPSFENIIEFKNVSFSHDEAHPFIKNINLSIKPGQVIGLIGLTGSGKSTFLNLLNRTYDISSGDLLLFGRPIKEYNLKYLKNIVRFIDQNPSFLSNSIKNNILLGHPELEEDLSFALKQSDCYDFVFQFPDNIEHTLEPNATNLSGGQRQRLSIARAFIGDPKILILDDTTSSLDFATESFILKNIFSYIKEKKITTFISSQKISTISTCDQILVWDEGKIESIGDHSTLLKISPIYQMIYKMQTKEVS